MKQRRHAEQNFNYRSSPPSLPSSLPPACVRTPNWSERTVERLKAGGVKRKEGVGRMGGWVGGCVGGSEGLDGSINTAVSEHRLQKPIY